MPAVLLIEAETQLYRSPQLIQVLVRQTPHPPIPFHSPLFRFPIDFPSEAPQIHLLLPVLPFQFPLRLPHRKLLPQNLLFPPNAAPNQPRLRLRQLRKHSLLLLLLLLLIL
ncbi:hypothetical protein M5K25_018546 [Dendrobium thyrsiflorum]|uniref:Uncharacterized protein n=1 Tax=Dendrobium thyrsiflorum TaxID=117978 RepID=A0ABD0UIW9_DENTH